MIHGLTNKTSRQFQIIMLYLLMCNFQRPSQYQQKIADISADFIYGVLVGISSMILSFQNKKNLKTFDRTEEEDATRSAVAAQPEQLNWGAEEE